MSTNRGNQPGIRVRHSRSCRTRGEGDCDCAPTYEAYVYSRWDQRKIRRSFPTLAAAKGWRTDAKALVNDGKLRAPSHVKVRAAAKELVAGMRSGRVRTRSGREYKPRVIADCERIIGRYIVPELGALRLSRVERRDVQRLVDDLAEQGRDGRTVRNVLTPLRVIYRRGLEDGEVAVSPCENLRLPAARDKRRRATTPQETEALLDALEPRDRALWSCAFRAGLRAGELAGLDWGQVDLAKGEIAVRRAYDFKTKQMVDPKSETSVRVVPIDGALRDDLVEHRMRTARSEGLVFGRAAEQPFSLSGVTTCARCVWLAAGLDPVTLHVTSHCYISMMIAAGVDPPTVAKYVGHSSTELIYRRYAHAIPGRDAEAMQKVETYREEALRAAS